MPHSRKLSQDSSYSFNLGIDERPITSDGASTKRASSSYGVAITSTPSQDERAVLPSQRESRPNAYKHKSAPGPAEDQYSELPGLPNEGLDNLLSQLKLNSQKSNSDSMRSFSYNEASKRRSQYYEEQFQYKDNAMGQTREKVQRQSPVIAELKTNVIIKDEFTLVTDLSNQLAQRYTRPDSCIMIKVDHSVCLAMGGNFDPCYLLTIHAVPSQMGPSTNKRNAALVQAFLADILSVPAERGIVTFQSVAEENLAVNGTTLLGEIEKQEKLAGTDPKSSIKDAGRRSMTFPKSNLKPNGDYKSNGNLAAESSSNKSLSPSPPAVAGATGTNDRPLTAHGAYDGLRMNGISTDQLVGKNSRTPNGRPKTVGANSSTSVQESLKKEPLPHVSQQSQRTSTSSTRPSATTINQRPSTTTTTTTNQRPSGIKMPATSTSQAANANKDSTPLAPRPVQLPHSASATTMLPTASSRPKHTPIRSETTPLKSEIRARNTYLDNVSSLTKKNNSMDPAIVVTDDDDDRGRTAAANTARRRSTISATPKMPPLQPPPVPNEDTKSINSRVGKRKSLLKMFTKRASYQ
ncbi:hypothetical protein LTR37_000527 [Vermiconidia calcicola]|uniref:Uncharacterized protein n=1 Tax=Vermiconidia calcicola TaxID=1690605 RepID=A0ACC3NYI8_9PEZI|nr:hypothetical protein LTR37_000527 [Vermiconidia calcicola]